MSKRGHFEEQDYIEWLRSMGCVFYAPLSENGDLQDRISGLPLQLTGQGSILWDGSQQMYKITQPSLYDKYVAFLNNYITVQDFPDDNFTTLHSIKKISNSSSKSINSMSPSTLDQVTSQSLSAVYNSTGRTRVWPANLANVAYVSNNDQRNRTFYQNGELYGTYAEYLPGIPSNWVMSGSGIIFGFTARASVFLSTQYYMKEVYLFNTALDLQTIRKIQGYE